MKMRTAIVVLAVLFLALAGAVAAQQQAKIPRVGFLFMGSKDQPHLDAFRQGLRDLGYVEGKNIVIENRYAEGKQDALPGLAAELVGANFDVILTTTPQASRAALQATNTIPIVITGFDPVLLGMAKSLAQPGGNLTGLTSGAGGGMIGKRLELLKEAFPRIKIVGNLIGGERIVSNNDIAAGVAKSLGLTIHHHSVKDGTEIEASYEVFKKLRIQAMQVSASAVMTQNSKQVINLMTKLRVPAIYASTALVDQGGLMAYSVNFADLYRRAAIYVDKILKGRKPSDLPIEQPMKFDLVVNLKAAKQIGVEVAPNLLARAERVIR